MPVGHLRSPAPINQSPPPTPESIDCPLGTPDGTVLSQLELIVRTRGVDR